jgi:hypothetical protein
MSHDYARLNKMVRKHMSALTRAKKTRDPDKIITVCDKAFDEFDLPENIYPDNWHLWKAAKQEAEWAKQRGLLCR